MMEGVDYAWERPSPTELRKAGKEFACRYLAYQPNGKTLTGAEREALHAAGLAVILNWEQAQGDMLNGYARGKEHASEALRQANALGAPSDVPIYFSCDVNITTADAMTSVQNYLHGAVSVLGRNRVGIYGMFSVIERTVGPLGICDWGWQTYAWSNGKLSNRAHIYQYQNNVIVAGQTCDLDRSLKPEIGAWTVELTGRSLELLNNIDTYLNRISQMELVIPLKNNGVTQDWNNKLASSIAAINGLSDQQITSLATQLASLTDVTLIKRALIDVLVHGTDTTP